MAHLSNDRDAARSRLGRLLADSVGYAVSSASGAPVGRIIWLTFEFETECPAGLRVQPEDALTHAPVGSWEIPADRVVRVAPSRREVVVAAPAERAERRAA